MYVGYLQIMICVFVPTFVKLFQLNIKIDNIWTGTEQKHMEALFYKEMYMTFVVRNIFTPRLRKNCIETFPII